MKKNGVFRSYLPLIMAMIITFAIGYFPSQVQATMFLDFGMNADHTGHTATVSYLPGDNRLVGTDIEVDDVMLLGGSQLLALIDGALNFETGPYLGKNATNDKIFGANYEYGSIELIGGIAALNIDEGTTLMKGYILPGVEVDVGNTPLVMQFIDYKHPALLEYFGMPQLGYLNDDGLDCQQYFGEINLSMYPIPGSQLEEPFFQVKAASGDIINQPVPEPATCILFLFGIAGMVGVKKKVS